MQIKDQENTYTIRLLKKGATPANTDIAVVSAYLKNISDLVHSIVLSEKPDAEDELLLSLVDLPARSTGIKLLVHHLAVFSALNLIALCAAETSTNRLSDESRNLFLALHDSARKYGHDIEFPEHKKGIRKKAILRYTQEYPLEKSSASIRGATTIYGELLRVGGVTPKAMIRIPGSNYPLNINIGSKELAKSLAPRIYEQVGLSGEAVWESENMQIVDFTASSLVEFKEAGVADVFRRLRDVAEDDFKNIDAVGFIESLREG